MEFKKDAITYSLLIYPFSQISKSILIEALYKKCLALNGKELGGGWEKQK